MLNNLYCIKDTVADHCASPFVMQNDLAAKRALRQLATEPQSAVYKSPEDYALFQIGTYDDDTGIVNAYNPPLFLTTASQLIKEN